MMSLLTHLNSKASPVRAFMERELPNVHVLHVGENRNVIGEEQYLRRLEPLVEKYRDRATFFGVMPAGRMGEFFSSIDVLVVSPGLTCTNFSQNMLEQKAVLRMDHLRGMSAEAVAEATLRSLERGRNEVSLTLGGRLIVLVNRFFPRLADRIAARRVRELFNDEIEARRRGEPGGQPATVEAPAQGS